MDFTSTPQYEKLLIDFPPGITPKGVWQHLSCRRSYELGLTKASFLTHPVTGHNNIATSLFLS